MHYGSEVFKYLILLEQKIWLGLETDHLSLQSFIKSLMFLGCYLDIQSFTVLYEAQALRGFLSILVIFLIKLFANGMVADRNLMKVRNLVHNVLVLESSLSY